MVLKWILIPLLFNSILRPAMASEKPYYDIESAEALFADFVKTHNKSYASEEYKKRFEIFVESLKTINKLNEEYKTVTFGINAYSDRTLEEKTGGLGLRPDLDISQEQLADIPDMDGDIPESVDWRMENAVNPVKSQGKCGSCWAFSAVAVIESQQAIKHKKLLSLSEQQLVDCVYNVSGCNAGNAGRAFTYAAKAGGMMLESDYPYKGEGNDDCEFDPKKVAVNVINGTRYKAQNETQMAKLVANYGPIAIAIQFYDDLDKYKGGVITPNDCNQETPTNHAVAIVGYGTDKGTPYWLIRNSWGTSYGEEGYLRLYRGKALCKITKIITTVNIE